VSVSQVDLETHVRDGLREDQEKVCRVGSPSDAVAFSFEIDQLTVSQRERFDDGEAPEFWLQWWVDQAERIRGRDGAAMMTLEPGLLRRRWVSPISIDGLRSLMDTTLWTMPAGVVLAWGVAPSAMGRSHLRRIDCAGALSVGVDGCVALLVCDPQICTEWLG